MKKYLIISIIFLILLTQTAAAGHKLDYFRKQIDGWGMDVYTLDLDKRELAREDPTINYLPKADESSYFLITSQELALLDLAVLQDYSKVILVCDSVFELSAEVSCDYSSITTSRDLPKLSDNSDYQLLNLTLGTAEIILLPEVNFVIPANVTTSAGYFGALGKAVVAANSEIDSDQVLSDKVGAVASTPYYFELLGYLVLVSLGIWIAMTFRNVVSGKFNLQDKLLVAYDFTHRYILIIKILLFVLFVLVLASNIYFIFSGGLHLIKDSLSMLIISDSLSSLVKIPLFYSILAFIVIAVNILFTILVFLYIFAYLPRNYHHALSFFEEQLPAARTKPLIYALCVLLLLSSVFLTGMHLVEVTLFLLASLIYVLAISKKLVLSLYEKAFVLAVILLVVIFSLIYKPIKTGNSIQYGMDGVFSDTDRVVLLPYMRRIDDNVKFQDYLVDVDFPILVNSFLIYHPDFSIIKNRNITEFDPSSNFMILANGEKYFKFLSRNYNILPYLYSAESTKFVSFSVDATTQDTLYVQLDFDCTEDTAPREIFLKKYNSTFQSVEYGLLVFPGCTSETPVISYVTSINSEFLRDSPVFELGGYDKVKISNIKVFKNTVEVPVKFLKAPATFQVIGENTAIPSDELYVYSTDTKQNADVVMDSVPFNIASVLNDDPIFSTLSNNFVIWSPSQGALLSN